MHIVKGAIGDEKTKRLFLTPKDLFTIHNNFFCFGSRTFEVTFSIFIYNFKNGAHNSFSVFSRTDRTDIDIYPCS